MSVTTVQLFTDGGSRGNPGPAAAGYVILDDVGRRLTSGGLFLGVATCNVAEYAAVLMGLAQVRVAAQDATVVRMFADSNLCVNQLSGQWNPPKPKTGAHLMPYYRMVKYLESDFSQVRYTWIPREQNVAADAEVNAALDIAVLA